MDGGFLRPLVPASWGARSAEEIDAAGLGGFVLQNGNVLTESCGVLLPGALAAQVSVLSPNYLL